MTKNLRKAYTPEACHVKKHLGQHFLVDDQVIAAVIARLEASKTCGAILEIGPGRGALTEVIDATTSLPFYMVELDATLIPALKERFARHSRHILHADILQFPLASIEKPPLTLISNLPYNISGPMLFKLIHEREAIGQGVFILQKEVVDRITAPPGSKTYGLLSVLLQTFYNLSYHLTISPSAFAPLPKVASASFFFEKKRNVTLPCSDRQYIALVKAAFRQRRKKLSNALKTLGLPLDSSPANLLTLRAEALHYSDFVTLAACIVKGE